MSSQKILRLRGHSIFPSLVPAQAWVLDLGANTGEFSHAAVKAFGCHCVAVEANPDLFASLPIDGLFHSLHVAVWQSDEMVRFSIADHPEFSSVGGHSSSRHVREVEIEGLTLATILARAGAPRIDLMKVDIEGAEVALLLSTPAEVLAGMGQITVEFHESHGLISSSDLHEVYQRMENLGFDRYRFSVRHHGDVLFVNRRLSGNFSRFSRRLYLRCSQISVAAERCTRWLVKTFFHGK